MPRLLQQKGGRYGMTLTSKIVGYGDIGRAAAKLACNYGMKVLALQRNPFKSELDPVCDEVFGITGKQNNVYF